MFFYGKLFNGILKRYVLINFPMIGVKINKIRQFWIMTILYFLYYG